MAPNKEVIQKWIEALESGEYQQTKGTLRSNLDAFCCLGVLCELAVTESVIPDPVNHFGDWLYGTDEWDRRGGSLPRSVQVWAGFEEGDPRVNSSWIHPDYEEDEPFKATLADLNDSAGYDFNQIAQVIRSNFL